MKTSFLSKKRLNKCFPVNSAKFLRTTFFTEHLLTTFSTDSNVAFEFYIFIYFLNKSRFFVSFKYRKQIYIKSNAMQDYDSASRFRVDFVGLLLPKHI